ncbi:hypothetical protein JQ582_04745 [Bradyrhizobium japonicum]|uniref:hypothetical protein n=1 Tax=Bradyrhizobium japonicum TaxID=375 RepID=UPI001BAC5AA0|nr:hypothetical protein [Bradyrhizobium japonicum]MBR0728601.1 hypothetical protein [Bradyrhizobium japonicum]MBR0743217.1 hypothetical protein [Bradyrhizobium japonicum]
MTDIDDRSKPTAAMRHALPSVSSDESCSTEKRPETAPPLFVSAKTATAIPARHPALRDALIQASLDPSVRSIAYIPSACVASEPVELEAVVVQRDDGGYLLDVVPARRVRDLEQEGLAQMALAELGLRPMVLTAEEMRREPRCTNGRLVWSYRQTAVPVGLRMRILLTLRDEGPMSLGDLLKSIQSDVDPAPAVMALACANLVELDLVSHPLSPTTLVSYSDQGEIP